MSSSPIHICHIVYSFGTGGLENGMVNLINNLPDDQFKHSIVCITASDPLFVTRLTRTDVTIAHVNKPPGRSIGYWGELRKIVKQLKPDIIHTRNLATIESHVACIGLGAIRIHGEHGWDGPLAKHNKKFKLIRRLVKPLIDQYVVLSNEAFSYLRDDIAVSQSLIKVICNGVDLNKFSSRLQKKSSQSLKIITVGRLVSVKNFPLLITAMAELVREKRYSNVHLTLVGDGPMKQELSSLIAELDLQSNCQLIGDRSDIPQLLSDHDLFVLPSTAEGISNTILEAMASGLAVVASDVGGNSELVKDTDSGIIFRSESLPELVAGLKSYLDQQDLCLLHGTQGRARVEKLFSIENMVSQYANLYRDVNNK